jgi:periodic tryptophan protein 2
MSQLHNLLVVGDSSGKFTLVDLPSLNIVHSLHITSSSGKIATMDINRDGDWIAFGCPDLGQLMVWEWQSETCTSYTLFLVI